MLDRLSARPGILLTLILLFALALRIACFGGMQGASFDPDHSPNLVVTARQMACPEPAEGPE